MLRNLTLSDLLSIWLMLLVFAEMSPSQRWLLYLKFQSLHLPSLFPARVFSIALITIWYIIYFIYIISHRIFHKDIHVDIDTYIVCIWRHFTYFFLHRILLHWLSSPAQYWIEVVGWTFLILGEIIKYNVSCRILWIAIIRLKKFSVILNLLKDFLSNVYWILPNKTLS